MVSTSRTLLRMEILHQSEESYLFMDFGQLQLIQNATVARIRTKPREKSTLLGTESNSRCYLLFISHLIVWGLNLALKCLMSIGLVGLLDHDWKGNKVKQHLSILPPTTETRSPLKSDLPLLLPVKKKKAAKNRLEFLLCLIDQLALLLSF